MNKFLILMSEATATQAPTQSGDPMQLYYSLGMLALFVVLIYFMMIRPQKKRDKEIASMRSALKVGDTIVTTGGIKGKIINIKDDDFTIATGIEDTKLLIKKWCIRNVENEEI